MSQSQCTLFGIIALLAALAKELADTRAFVMQEIARLGSQQHERQMSASERAHDALMATGDHVSSLQQADQSHTSEMIQADQSHQQALEQLAAQPQSPLNGEQS